MKTSPSTAVFLSATSWTPRKESRPSTVQFFFLPHSAHASEILSLIGPARTSFTLPDPLHVLQSGGGGGVAAAAFLPIGVAVGILPVPSHLGHFPAEFRTWGR